MARLRDEILLKKIALRLKALREEKGISQEDLYNETNIHIGRIETGRANVSISTLSALCRHLGLSLTDFFKKIDK